MENEFKNERMDEPGSRFMREIEMLMTDSENKDVAEIFGAVTSEIPRALDEALNAGALSEDQKEEAVRRLSDIRDDVSRMPEAPETPQIMAGFESLLKKLSE